MQRRGSKPFPCSCLGMEATQRADAVLIFDSQTADCLDLASRLALFCPLAIAFGFPLLPKSPRMNYDPKYAVHLTEKEREQLEKLRVEGQRGGGETLPSLPTLKSDAGPEVFGPAAEQVSEGLDVSLGLMQAACQAYAEQRLTAALERKRPAGIVGGI